MIPSNSIEVTAVTVDDAIEEALEKLGAAEEDVIIEVLSTPRSGVLGLGSRPARVRVSRRPPEAARSGVQSPPPAPPPRSAAPKARERASVAAAPTGEEGATEITGEASGEEPAEGGRKSAGSEEQKREATALLCQILDLMGEKAEVHEAQGEPDVIELDIKGDGSGILIGRHGQTLDALEYLVNRLLARKIRDAVPIVLDTESYRARRRYQLERMALSMGEQAKREHAPVKLDPMPPRDRRIVHLALKDDPLITTRSSGDGFLRSIEILPVGERRERGGRDRERPERQRDRQPVGQQGGFKHGQKKIV
jgi:spoIIIJ-associated protein